MTIWACEWRCAVYTDSQKCRRRANAWKLVSAGGRLPAWEAGIAGAILKWSHSRRSRTPPHGHGDRRQAIRSRLKGAIKASQQTAAHFGRNSQLIDVLHAHRDGN